MLVEEAVLICRQVRLVAFSGDELDGSIGMRSGHISLNMCDGLWCSAFHAFE
jgi:hypothetical protein